MTLPLPCSLQIPESSSCVRIDKASLRGPGMLVLTGPSSCGKGAVAHALSKVLSIPPYAHLSMGDILRNVFLQAKQDSSYAALLADKYAISAVDNIFDCIDTSDELTKKVRSHISELEFYFKRTGMDCQTSQLEWLEFCTMNGLLVPNRWTQNFLAAHVEHVPAFRSEAFILDGYPRTVKAAEHLLSFLSTLHIPVIKVLHLSISKQEMLSRATKRGRADDDELSLLSRYNFYIENVHPSIDFFKTQLGSQSVALIDAHQPYYVKQNGENVIDLHRSILNVVESALRSLGVSRSTVKDLLSQI